MTPSRRPLAVLVLGCLVLSTACGGEAAPRSAALPWTTEADSSGDTIRVRITGDVPDSMVRTLVPTLEVGALEGADEVTFGYVGDVLGLADGGLLVHDGEAELIRLYDSTGAFVRTLGGKGGGPGEYTQVNGIARHPNGDLWVWDAGGSRLNRYTATGEFVATHRHPLSGWFTQNQLHVDADGRLGTWYPLIPDPDNPFERQEAWVRLDTSGTVIDTLKAPTWPGDAEPLQASSRDGRSRSMASRPWAANAVTQFHPVGGLISGPATPYVFYVLPKVGRPLRVERTFTPVPVSDTERREREAQITQNMRRLDPSWSWTGAPIPATKPAYERFLLGEDGRIWVKVFTPAEPIPAEELSPVTAPPGGGPPPVQRTTREPAVYDVFAPDGRLLGRVALPARTRLMRASGDSAWGTRQDADGVDYAVRFRISPALAP